MKRFSEKKKKNKNSVKNNLSVLCSLNQVSGTLLILTSVPNFQRKPTANVEGGKVVKLKELSRQIHKILLYCLERYSFYLFAEI